MTTDMPRLTDEEVLALLTDEERGLWSEGCSDESFAQKILRTIATERKRAEMAGAHASKLMDEVSAAYISEKLAWEDCHDGTCHACPRCWRIENVRCEAAERTTARAAKTAEAERAALKQSTAECARLSVAEQSHFAAYQVALARAEKARPRYVDGRKCVVCSIEMREGCLWDPLHHACAPTIMTPNLRRDMEQLITVLRARNDVSRSVRMRVDRVAVAMGAKP